MAAMHTARPTRHLLAHQQTPVAFHLQPELEGKETLELPRSCKELVLTHLLVAVAELCYVSKVHICDASISQAEDIARVWVTVEQTELQELAQTAHNTNPAVTTMSRVSNNQCRR